MLGVFWCAGHSERSLQRAGEAGLAERTRASETPGAVPTSWGGSGCGGQRDLKVAGAPEARADLCARRRQSGGSVRLAALGWSTGRCHPCELLASPCHNCVWHTGTGLPARSQQQQAAPRALASPSSPRHTSQQPPPGLPAPQPGFSVSAQPRPAQQAPNPGCQPPSASPPLSPPLADRSLACRLLAHLPPCRHCV